MATEAPTVPVKPTETINVKGMSDRWKAAQAAGGIPPTPPPAPTTPEPPKPEPVKAVEPPAPTEPKAGVPEAPKPKPEPVKAPEPPKPPEKIPSTNFKELEASRDEYRKKAEAAEAKAKEIEAKLSTAVDPAKITELESKLEKANKQAEQAQEFVDRFYLEHSRKFQLAYADKIDDTIERLKEKVGEKADEIEKILRKGPSKSSLDELEEASADLSDMRKRAIVDAYDKIEELHNQRSKELKNSKENVKKLQEYEGQQAKAKDAEVQKAYDSAYTSELVSFEVGVDGFKEIDGNNDYNAIVKANRERAETFSKAASPVDNARKALWAAYGVHAKMLVDAQTEKIAKLEKQLAEIQGANPGIRSGTAAPSQPATGNEKPGDRTVRRWNEAQTKGIPPKE